MKKTNGTPSVKFKYIKSAEHKIIPVHGGYGGLGPRGGIDLHLYYERTQLPDEQVYELKNDGSLGKVIDQTLDKSVLREILITVSMDPNTARSIAKWLNDKADLYESLTIKKDK